MGELWASVGGLGAGFVALGGVWELAGDSSLRARFGGSGSYICRGIFIVAELWEVCVRARGEVWEWGSCGMGVGEPWDGSGTRV